MKIGNKKTWAGALFLIATEQLIKIIINNNFLEKKLSILPPLLYFQPVFNRRYSWFNSMLELGNGKWFHIIAVSIMIIFLCLFYNYINKEFGSSSIINVMFAFLFSGAACSLIDKVFWNGSLDYIYVNGLFTFDLKDVYLNIFNGLLILMLLVKNKTLEQISDKNIFRGFAKYLLGKS